MHIRSNQGIVDITPLRILFDLVYKRNLYEKAFCNVKTKTMPHFAVKYFQRSNH